MLQAGRSPVRIPDEVDFLNLPNPSSRTMALGSPQPLTEISTKNLPGGKKCRRVGLTSLPPSISGMSENAGASTSCNPKGLQGLYRENFTLLIKISVPERNSFLWFKEKQDSPYFHLRAQTRTTRIKDNVVKILSRVGVCVIYRRVLDWTIGYVDTLYTQLVTRDNYSAIDIPTVCRSLLYFVSSVYYTVQ
jgi:hypothetical protein